MPRKFPKPFFRTGRGWFVQLGKQQIKLADGPENPNTEATAWDEYHKVMVSRDCAPELTEAADALSVAEVFERFLAWCVNHREPRTYEWYKDHIQSFVNSLNGEAKQPYAALKPFHVIEWTDGHKNWSAAYRRGAIVAVSRPFNWAERLGYIDRSPIRGVEKPQAQRREQFVTLEDWERIRGCFVEGDPFRDFLEFCWETGCPRRLVRRDLLRMFEQSAVEQVRCDSRRPKRMATDVCRKPGVTSPAFHDRQHFASIDTPLRQLSMAIETAEEGSLRPVVESCDGDVLIDVKLRNAEAYVDAYLAAAGISNARKTPLFRTLDRRRKLTDRRINANDVLRMVKRHARQIGLTTAVRNHTFRATGITEYLRAGGTLERAAAIAAHESTRTTQLYNRLADEISLDEIERIVI